MSSDTKHNTRQISQTPVNDRGNNKLAPCLYMLVSSIVSRENRCRLTPARARDVEMRTSREGRPFAFALS